MKKISVSEMASISYQMKKKNSASFNPKEEWKKAMKQAWATVHSTKESRAAARKTAWSIQEKKRIAIATARAANTAAVIDRMSKEVNAMSEEDKGLSLAEAIYADYEKKWSSKRM